MAWPDEAGSLGLIEGARGSRARVARGPRSKVLRTLAEIVEPSGSGPDSLRIEAAGYELRSLAIAGTIRGVAPLHAAARNGPGLGRLASLVQADRLAWRAPGSSRFGPPVRCAVDGDYVLRDGDDRDKFLRVRVTAAELLGLADAPVELSDVYNNRPGMADVTAAEAAAGDVEIVALTLRNVSRAILSQLTAWLDPDVVDLEISDDRAAWVSPVSEPGGLVFGDLAPQATTTVYLRRSIAAGTAESGGMLNHLRFRYFGQ